MADKPVTREEKYLAYLTGDYTGELPKPITRKEKYLYELCLKGIGGEISPEEIKNAVNEYLEKNPVKPGATTEQAQQIEQNRTDVASLKEDVKYLSAFYVTPEMFGAVGDGVTDDTKAINDCLLYCKEHGFDCLFERKTYKVSKSGGSGGESYAILLQPNVNIDFNFSTIQCDDSCCFFHNVLNVLYSSSIVSDTRQGDYTVIVEDASGFNIGDDIYVIYGENPTDTHEPGDFFFANIVDITDNILKINVQLPFNVEVLTLQNKNNNKICKYEKKGKLNNIRYKNAKLLGGYPNTEAGFYLMYAEDIFFDNITSEECGAGIIIGQFCNNISLNDIFIEKNVGYTQKSKGRGISFSSSHNIKVGNAYLCACERSYVISESNTDIKIKTLYIKKGGIQRLDNYFGIFYKSRIHIENLYFVDECNDNAVEDTFKLTCDNVQTYNEHTMNGLSLYKINKTFNKYDMHDVIVFIKKYSITSEYNTFQLPAGKIKDFYIELKSDVPPSWLSFGRAKNNDMSDGSLNGADFHTQFKNGEIIRPAGSNIPIIYNLLDSYLYNYDNFCSKLIIEFPSISNDCECTVWVEYLKEPTT
jgi:hypothetical protein